MRRRKSRGHNLLEAIIAGMLFAAVTVGLMGVWDMQFQAMLKSKETAVASFLAERKMEEAVAAGFDNIMDETATVQVRSRTKAGEKQADYVIVVDVEDHPTDVDQRTVVVRVEFTDSTGPQSVEFHTVLNRHA